MSWEHPVAWKHVANYQTPVYSSCIATYPWTCCHLCHQQFNCNMVARLRERQLCWQKVNSALLRFFYPISTSQLENMMLIPVFWRSRLISHLFLYQLWCQGEIVNPQRRSWFRTSVDECRHSTAASLKVYSSPINAYCYTTKYIQCTFSVSYMPVKRCEGQTVGPFGHLATNIIQALWK